MSLDNSKAYEKWSLLGCKNDSLGFGYILLCEEISLLVRSYDLFLFGTIVIYI